MQRENNKEILNDLINKKIREYIQTNDVSAMTEEQLRVHVRRVADEVVGQFKTLKNPSGSFVIGKSVDAIVKILMANQQELGKTLLILSSSKDTNMAPTVAPQDYQMLETVLMEKYDASRHEAENMKKKVADLTLESFNIKKEIASEREVVCSLILGL